MNINITSISHNLQRYPTVGDWEWTENGLQIRVSNMSDERYIALVAIHELIEAVLCRQHNITTDTVDRFDMQFEKQRAEIEKQGVICLDEPGDDANCPYRIEHGIASGIERIIASQLGVDWNKYSKEVEAL